MAILRNGANGGFSGKVGAVIGYQLNGQDIIRSVPKKRLRKPSKAEALNRTKFALTQRWLQPLLIFLRVGFKNYAPTYQGFVAAKSYNSIHALQQNAQGEFYIDPALARLSFGNLSLPQSMEMQHDTEEIVVSWSREGQYQPIDVAMLMAYVPTTGATSFDLAAAKRQTGSASLRMPSNPTAQQVLVYIAFIAYDQSAQSHSHYLGAIDP